MGAWPLKWFSCLSTILNECRMIQNGRLRARGAGRRDGGAAGPRERGRTGERPFAFDHELYNIQVDASLLLKECTRNHFGSSIFPCLLPFLFFGTLWIIINLLELCERDFASNLAKEQTDEATQQQVSRTSSTRHKKRLACTKPPL